MKMISNLRITVSPRQIAAIKWCLDPCATSSLIPACWLSKRWDLSIIRSLMLMLSCFDLREKSMNCSLIIAAMVNIVKCFSLRSISYSTLSFTSNFLISSTASRLKGLNPRSNIWTNKLNLQRSWPGIRKRRTLNSSNNNSSSSCSNWMSVLKDQVIRVAVSTASINSCPHSRESTLICLRSLICSSTDR